MQNLLFYRLHTFSFFLLNLFMIIFILPGLPFFQSVIFSNGPQSRKASHFSPSSSSNSFFCSLVCLKAATNTFSLRATYALEQQRTSLNLHTKTDAIMSMQGYAAFGNIIICCNLLNSYSSQGKLFSDGLGGKQYGVFLSVLNNFRN